MARTIKQRWAWFRLATRRMFGRRTELPAVNTSQAEFSDAFSDDFAN